MSIKDYRRLVLFGDGWGAEAAIKGLQDFPIPVNVVSTDESVIRFANDCAKPDLLSYQNELLLFAGFKPIVPKCVVEKNCCINIHYSLLPQYRGLHSTVWAILNDEDYLGVTIHLMNQFIDDGAILYQYKVPNDRISTSKQYMSLFNAKITEVLSSVLTSFLTGALHPVEQDKSQASWVGFRHENDCMIDCTKPISYQKAFFRALVTPYPLPHISHKGKNYVVQKASFHQSNVVTHIGRILNIDNDGIWVKIADGYIILQELLDAKGNRVVSFDDFKIGQYVNR